MPQPASSKEEAAIADLIGSPGVRMLQEIDLFCGFMDWQLAVNAIRSLLINGSLIVKRVRGVWTHLYRLGFVKYAPGLSLDGVKPSQGIPDFKWTTPNARESQEKVDCGVARGGIELLNYNRSGNYGLGLAGAFLGIEKARGGKDQ